MAAWLLYCVVSRVLYCTVLYCTCTAWSAGSPPPGSWPPPAPAETRPDPWRWRRSYGEDSNPHCPPPRHSATHLSAASSLVTTGGSCKWSPASTSRPALTNHRWVLTCHTLIRPIRGEYCGQLTNHGSPGQHRNQIAVPAEPRLVHAHQAAQWEIVRGHGVHSGVYCAH